MGTNTLNNRMPLRDRGDIVECTEADEGDDADDSECDAEWTTDVEVLFTDGTFGCDTTRMVTIMCSWDVDGGMATGRNALPNEFRPNGTEDDADDNNYANFLKCEAE